MFKQVIFLVSSTPGPVYARGDSTKFCVGLVVISLGLLVLSAGLKRKKYGFLWKLCGLMSLGIAGLLYPVALDNVQATRSLTSLIPLAASIGYVMLIVGYLAHGIDDDRSTSSED